LKNLLYEQAHTYSTNVVLGLSKAFRLFVWPHVLNWRGLVQTLRREPSTSSRYDLKALAATDEKKQGQVAEFGGYKG